MSLRARYERLSSSIARYESRVARQALQLDKMIRPKDHEEDADDDGDKNEDDSTAAEEPQ